MLLMDSVEGRRNIRTLSLILFDHAVFIWLAALKIDGYLYYVGIVEVKVNVKLSPLQRWVNLYSSYVKLNN